MLPNVEQEGKQSSGNDCVMNSQPFEQLVQILRYPEPYNLFTLWDASAFRGLTMLLWCSFNPWRNAEEHEGEGFLGYSAFYGEVK